MKSETLSDYKDKILVVLDLDETLIHATSEPAFGPGDFRVFDYTVYKRPFLADFLQELARYFHVAVWSSASGDYVAAVVKEIFPDGYPLEFVWARDRCTWNPDYRRAEETDCFDYFSHYDYVKKLEKIHRRGKFHKKRILIIDDTPAKCRYNYGNAVYPAEFRGDPADSELQRLIRYLKTLHDIEDVRSIEKRFWYNEVLL